MYVKAMPGCKPLVVSLWSLLSSASGTAEPGWRGCYTCRRNLAPLTRVQRRIATVLFRRHWSGTVLDIPVDRLSRAGGCIPLLDWHQFQAEDSQGDLEASSRILSEAVRGAQSPYPPSVGWTASRSAAPPRRTLRLPVVAALLCDLNIKDRLWRSDGSTLDGAQIAWDNDEVLGPFEGSACSPRSSDCSGSRGPKGLAKEGSSQSNPAW